MEHAKGESPIAFLYKLIIFFFVDRLFLITSNGVLRRNRHGIYAQPYTDKQ
jgi:hypothetical protein